MRRLKRKSQGIANTLSDKKRKYYFLLLVIMPIILSLVGLFFVFEASSVRGFNEFTDSFRYVKLQAVWVTLGIILMFVISFIDYQIYKKLSFMALVGSIVLLVAVLIPGIGIVVNGARRWIDLGLFNLQPSEFAKLGIIIYLSAWFSTKQNNQFFHFLIFLGMIIGLIMLQPDMGGSVIIFMIAISLYFFSGNPVKYLFGFIPIAAIAAFLLIKTSPYRFRRLMTFMDPTIDPLGSSYHINQIMISLANGGFMGAGFGGSRQKYFFLPEAHTDSIFAIIGEEIGFVGSTILIIVFLVFLYQFYLIALKAPDTFGKLLAGGILAYFTFQILMNLSAMVALIPLTGAPLPFISYGGSHILISFVMVGMAINIARQSRK